MRTARRRRVFGQVYCRTGSPPKVRVWTSLIRHAFAVVIHVTFTYFKVDKCIAGVLVYPKTKTEAGDGG